MLLSFWKNLGSVKKRYYTFVLYYKCFKNNLSPPLPKNHYFFEGTLSPQKLNSKKELLFCYLFALPLWKPCGFLRFLAVYRNVVQKTKNKKSNKRVTTSCKITKKSNKKVTNHHDKIIGKRFNAPLLYTSVALGKKKIYII